MTSKQAIVAIARKILVSIYHMFKKKAAWCPTDCNKEFIPNNVSQSKEARKLKTNIHSLLAMGMNREKLLETVNASADLYEKNLKAEEVFDHFTGEVLVTDTNPAKKVETEENLNVSKGVINPSSGEIIESSRMPIS